MSSDTAVSADADLTNAGIQKQKAKYVPVVYADRTISDPIPIVNPTLPPAQRAAGLNEVLQKVQDAIKHRRDAEDVFTWDELQVEPKLHNKALKGRRYRKMMDHCGGGPIVPFITMRNGPVDCAFLRK